MQLAAFLLHLPSRPRQHLGSEYQLNMSRRDLDSYPGVSMGTVSRLFARLQEQDITRIRRRSVRLLDLPAMRNIAEMPVLPDRLLISHQ